MLNEEIIDIIKAHQENIKKELSKTSKNDLKKSLENMVHNDLFANFLAVISDLKEIELYSPQVSWFNRCKITANRFPCMDQEWIENDYIQKLITKICRANKNKQNNYYKRIK